uniref:NAD-specific glutamate dehydrogenase n=1 Tax=Steinernema glaseri TaxID=37863 RepID=A0A1I8ACI2_9BILA
LAGNAQACAQLDGLVALVFDLQCSRRTLLAVTVDVHQAVARCNARLDQHLRVDVIGVATHHVQAQQVAVVIGLGRGAGNLAFAVVVVQAIAQAGIDEVVTLLEAAVQREGVAVHLGLVAAFAVDVGVDEAVRQAQGQVVVELAVGTHRDAAAQRVVGAQFAQDAVAVQAAQGQLAVGRGTLADQDVGDFFGALAGDGSHQLVVLQAVAVDLEQGRAAHQVQLAVGVDIVGSVQQIDAPGLEQVVRAALGAEVAALCGQANLCALAELGSTADGHHGGIGTGGAAQVQVQRRVAGHVQVAVDGGVRLHEVQVRWRIAADAAHVHPAALAQTDVGTVAAAVGAAEVHLAVHLDGGQVDQVAGDLAAVQQGQVHAALGFGGIDRFVFGDQRAAVDDFQPCIAVVQPVVIAVVDQLAVDTAAFQVDALGAGALGDDAASGVIEQVALDRAGEVQCTGHVHFAAVEQRFAGGAEQALVDDAAIDGGRVDHQGIGAAAHGADAALVDQVA